MLFRNAALSSLALLWLANCNAAVHQNNGAIPAWPMYQLKADHNAFLVRDDFSAQWTYDAGARINGGFAVAGNTLIFDTFANQIIALDIRNGTLLWKASTDNLVMSTPIVSDGLVFVGTGTNGNLYGRNGSFAYDSPWGRGPSVWGRREGDHILALDLASGEKRWVYRTMGEDMPSPAVLGGLIVFANGDGHAYALTSASGRPVWRLDLGGISTMASATVIHDLVLLSVCNLSVDSARTFALVALTGAVRWKAPFGSCDSSPTYGEGRVFLSGTQGNRETFGFGGKPVIAAVDNRSGRPQWVYRGEMISPYTSVGSSERAIAGTYANGMYLQAIPSEDRLIAFDAVSGRIRWQFHSVGPVKMSPVVRENRAYFGDLAGLFYTIDAGTGELIKARMFNQSFSVSPPIIIGNTVVVANDTIVRSFGL